MLARNRSDDTLILDFICHEDYPDEMCGALNGDYTLNDMTGLFVCNKCLGAVASQIYDTREDLYDEEDDQDAGAMNENSNFVAEGDRSMLDWSPDFTKRKDREDRIIELIDKLDDYSLTLFMANNQRDIIDELRKHEQSDNPLFRDDTSQRLTPKILAVAYYLRNVPPNRTTLLKVGSNPTMTLRLYQYLQRVGRPHLEAKIEMTFSTIGKQLGMPESLISSALEEWESSRPLTSIANPNDAIVAWLYVMAKKYNFKLNQKEALAKTGAGRNSTQKAIKEFKEFLRNLKVTKEIPTVHGLKEGDDLE